MKKFSFLAMAAASLMLASCSSDDMPSQGGRDGYVTFRAELPAGINTRAFGDGNTAVNLQYVVYNNLKTQVLVEGTKTLVDRTTDIEIPLVTGETYQIIFYADAFGESSSESPYTFNHSDGTLSINYDKTTTNDDKFDAFYNYVENFTVSQNMGVQTVELTRPFSQINIGTTQEDFDKAAALNIHPASSSVAIIPAFTKLDMFSGEAEGLQDVAVNFADNAFASGETISVGGTDYINLAMVYVLADKDSRLFNKVSMTLVEAVGTNPLAEPTKDYTSIPYKRNYRTNIVGDLLTSNTQWTVIIDNEFGGSVWLGETEAPVADATDPNLFHISNAAQLAGLAEIVNAGTNLFGKKYVLDADIDLNNTPWTPIGKAGVGFNGSFDGQGHTISNLNVDSDEYAGLFGFINNAWDGSQAYVGTYIKNIKIVNAKIKGAHFLGAIAGNIATRREAEITGNSVENVVIEGVVKEVKGELEDANKIGAMFGILQLNSVKVQNNTVKNAVIYGGRDTGGLAGRIGHMDETDSSFITNISGNTVKDVTIYKLPIDNSNNFGELAGLIAGTAGKWEVGTNYISNVVIGSMVEDQAGLNSALSSLTADSSTVICLADGTYTIPSVGVKADITIVGNGAENTTLSFNYAEYNMSESTVTLQNLKVKTANEAYNGMMRCTKINYDNCVIEGLLVTYSPVEFNECTFNAVSDVYPVKVYGSTSAIFNKCQFNAYSKARGILIYQEPNTNPNSPKYLNVVVKDCNFSASASNTKGAIQMNTENGTIGCLTVSGCTYDSNFESLWKEWWNTGDEHTTYTWKVIVDGVTVQEGTPQS